MSSFRNVVTSVAGAAGLVLLVPFAVLLVGLPIALVLRAIVEALSWLFG